MTAIALAIIVLFIILSLLSKFIKYKTISSFNNWPYAI
ncbi:hypothetical protein HMPREF1564_1680 [Providencia alcalifaciens R90-1475]|nr:hypothetical protein HMPREF1564_1680 [Providencia alcalifaciens R90-1475]